MLEDITSPAPPHRESYAPHLAGPRSSLCIFCLLLTIPWPTFYLLKHTRPSLYLSCLLFTDKLTMCALRMASKFRPSCLSLLNTGITSTHHHAKFLRHFTPLLLSTVIYRFPGHSAFIEEFGTKLSLFFLSCRILGLRRVAIVFVCPGLEP